MCFPKSLQGPASALTLLSSLPLSEVRADENDSFGDQVEGVSQQVTSVLESPDALRISHFQRLSADRCCFQWNGDVGKTYRVEMSEDLKSWQTLPGGLMHLEKPEDALCEVENLTGHRSCFFRVSEVLEPFLPSTSSIDSQSWLDYVSRFSETLSFEEQQKVLAGTFEFQEDPDFEISVADKQAEIEARIADFPTERARLISQDKYLVQQHNQRIYEAAAVAALKIWFPNENYGADKASYLNTNPMRQSLDIEIYNRGGYRKEKTSNEWNEYFQKLEQDLWEAFEEYKKKKEAYDWKKNQSVSWEEVDFTTSVEALFPMAYAIDDSNRSQFESFVQAVLSAEINGISSNSFSPEQQEAHDSLLLQPEFLQTEIAQMRTQINVDFRNLELRISDAANAESARTGEPKRWIVARLWSSPFYANQKIALNQKSGALDRLTQKFLTADVFEAAREARLNLERNHAEQKTDYEILREHCFGRKAFLEAQKMLSEDLDLGPFLMCEQVQAILKNKKTDTLPWTLDIKRIQNLLPTLTALRSWEDFLYNEFLVGSLNQSSQDIAAAKQHFLSEQVRLQQQVNNSFADHQLNEYWGAVLSSRTPFRPEHESVLRGLVYNAHNQMVAAYEAMPKTQYFVRNPMEVQSESVFYSEQLTILQEAEKIYFQTLDESIQELQGFWEARKNYTLELYVWLQKDPAMRGGKPVFSFPSLADILLKIEARVNEALLRATLYGESHRLVEKKDVYGDPEKTLAQLVGTMQYFGSPPGKAITKFENQQMFNELIRPGGYFYEKYKHDPRFVDPETGELISTLNIAKAESGMYPSLSVGREPEGSVLPVETPQPEDMEHLLGENFHSLSLEEQERRLSLALAAYTGEGVDLEKEEVNFDRKLLEGIWQPAQGVLDFFKNRFWVVDESFLSGEFRAYYSTIDDIFDREIATHEVFKNAINNEFSVGSDAEKQQAYNLAVLITKLTLIKEMTGTTSLDKKIKNAQEDLAETGVFPQTWEERSNAEIRNMYPTLRYAAASFINHLNNKYLEKNIFLRHGRRTFNEQSELYKQGRDKPGNIVTYAQGGYSYHNYGLAFDIAGKTLQGATDYGLDWESIGEVGEGFGFEWGGDWIQPEGEDEIEGEDEAFRDKPHFQLRFGYSVDQLKTILEEELLHQGFNQEQVLDSRELIKKQLGYSSYLFNPITE